LGTEDRPGHLAANPNGSSWISSFAELSLPPFPAAHLVSEFTVPMFRYTVFFRKTPEDLLINKTFIFMLL
jgi:hypothetical protein